MPDQNVQSDDEIREEFKEAFCLVASLQGRIAYFLMSIYAVNPMPFQYVTTVDLYPFLLWNMIYGFTIMIMSRRFLQPIVSFQRFSFGLLASLAFNYSTLTWYKWLNEVLEDRIVLRTILAYLSGRVFIVHLWAFLYHVDARSSPNGDSDRGFEAMYL